MAAARPTRILLDVSDNVSPIKDEERPLCEEWLQSVGFLAPGKDQDMWVAIVQNWEQFLKTTKTKITGSDATRRFVLGIIRRRFFQNRPYKQICGVGSFPHAHVVLPHSSHHRCHVPPIQPVTRRLNSEE
ncbi:flavin containing protein [Fusarium mundagurra]|uniref:Flavin containing protein n=1 Tax=Fusarium mundagurra TaxID=1567541 RepID=A0A8H5Y2G9_9HYPO|nr:flavin containing protein [Fusarium mundagurra]